ncbi:MAG: hypothetical protein A2831_01310 [Candidatus Yanofskybacteria bacterium RIFCSPHIGHO2_01_FULL_44_17]|uniref:Glutamine--fructose-6-phosphate aminotransferase [isomerizing] n=1 Tax=Candidatus Yanofskybacteria bacterium RIFCSPHIGHO2_01_FULL_44_17 TaxID=1802668 RepID=A0A1F8EV95_9BACT|nr:MAG: hypothetical protein A2831_01310 [Candidatus Yanofskybacteria bacterium RIFCSPHIGHO2_01_FULL_44_17]
MCGIAGYVGKKDGLVVVMNCLKRLEYRGYDSAGVLFFSAKGGSASNGQNDQAELKKSPGKLTNLEKKVKNSCATPLLASIGHTRWATHGTPNETNAHPHADCHQKIFLVHNGIIENYRELKEQLEKRGHKFKSQTDTETVVHLLEDNYDKGATFEKTLDLTLKKIVGAYAFGIINQDEPQKIYFARLGSPLVLGIGTKEYFLASDQAALAGMAKKIIYLKEGQRGWISPTGFKVWPNKPIIERLDLNTEVAQKSGLEHFMLKEIFEQPETIKNALRGRLSTNGVKLGGLESVSKKLSKIKNLEIIACGTSYNAGLIGKLLFEEISDIPTSVSLASEHRYQQIAHRPDTGYIFISQSGETADTLAALKKIKTQGYLTLGLVNVVGSAIARETQAGIYNHAGPEISVASTKAFTSQLTILALMALCLGTKNKNKKELARELTLIPNKVKLILKQNDQFKALAKKYLQFQNFMFIGRKYNYPTALEGTLKLKEISYVHAEGIAAGELKHGSLALIDPHFPIFTLTNKNSVYEKMLSNMEEVKARGGKIISIATAGDRKIASVANDVIYVPKTLEPFEPLLNSIALQLFAYHFGVLRGHDVDKPRNLAKSVTVE